MTLEEQAREEAIKRYSSRLIEDYDGDRYDEDEYGYDATARAAFLEGAKWAMEQGVPASEDEREALARILDGSDPEMGGVVADEGHESWEWYLPQVDAVLAAGFRRLSPVTDAQVEAAMREHDYSLDRETTRKALEAALEVQG